MSKFSGVTRVIFDLDNTLIKHDFEKLNDTLANRFEVEDRETFKKQFSCMLLGHSAFLKKRIVTYDYFTKLIENMMPILKSLKINGADILEANDRYHTGSLMEGAEEILEYLCGKGYQIVAATNWFYQYQLNILNKLGISDYFERIYAWDDYYAKPNHFAMIKALDGTDEKSNIMIGDSAETDVKFAKNAGVKVIGLNVDYTKVKENMRADVDITNLLEIKNYL